MRNYRNWDADRLRDHHPPACTCYGCNEARNQSLREGRTPIWADDPVPPGRRLPPPNPPSRDVPPPAIQRRMREKGIPSQPSSRRGKDFTVPSTPIQGSSSVETPETTGWKVYVAVCVVISNLAWLLLAC